VLIRRGHKLRAVRVRRLHPDTFTPGVMVGPVFLRYPRRTCGDYWRQQDLEPRRLVRGRWLPPVWAWNVEWARRKNRPAPDVRLHTMAARCGLHRFTDCPF